MLVGLVLSRFEFHSGGTHHLFVGRRKLLHGIRAVGAARTERYDLDGYPTGGQVYGPQRRRTEGINGPVIRRVTIYFIQPYRVPRGENEAVAVQCYAADSARWPR